MEWLDACNGSGVPLGLPARTDARGAGVFAGACTDARLWRCALAQGQREQHESRDEESDLALNIDASHASGSFEQRQLGCWYKDVQRSCLTSGAFKMAAGLQRENHLMNRGR